MINNLKLVCTVLILFFALAQAEARKKSHGAMKEKLSRDVRFSAIDVNGKYQLAGEAVVTVEDEKVLKDILVLRSDFKDRIRQEQRRQ